MAAGLGFKDFTTGEVLTAADVDGYLMQGVWVFASAAARDAAVTSPQEGNFAYLKDTNVTTYYTGSAWANLDTTGMTNPMTTTGDTIYSSSGSTPARLGIGSTGNVLTVAGGVPTWSAPSSGSLTKVVSTTFSAVSTQAFQSCFTSTYRSYLVMFSYIRGSAKTDFNIQFYTGTNTLRVDYSGGVLKIPTTGTPTTGYAHSYTTPFSLGKMPSSSGEQYAGGMMTVYSATDLAGQGSFSAQTQWQTGGGIGQRESYLGSINIDGNPSTTGFVISPASGTVSGTITVYGLEN
jgi:hypothetical protein